MTDKKEALQEIGQMASEVSRIASGKPGEDLSDDELDDRIGDCRDLVRKMDEALPDD